VIEAVVVDLGGVVALEPSAEAWERLRSCCRLGGDAFEAIWYRHRPAYDRGELTAPEYWRLVGVEDESAMEEILAADAEAWSRCEPSLVDWLPALRAAGLKVGVLSNMPREQWAVLAPRFAGWLEQCDHVTLSFEVGAAKPDPRIYRHCLERLGVRPDAALFVDDRPENVDAALAIGLHAVLYTGVQALRTELAGRFGDALPLPA
jgi:putative hydrolase of the HAD superfamily